MASVLETFIVLFKGDTTDLKKGSKDAKKTTDDLQKSIKDTDTVAGKLGGSFTNMIRQATGALTAIVGVATVIGGLKYATHFADQLGELSDALSVDVEALSSWGDAVKMSGGTAEGFYETVKSMTASLADFATKGTSRAAPFFVELGIKMTDAKGKARNFIDVLPEIAASFEKLSRSESFGIGRKMGLDNGTIMLLQKGRKEVELFIERQKELGVITKKDTEIAAKYNDTWDDTVHAFRSLAVSANSEILPFLTIVVKGFQDLAILLRENPSLVKAIGLALGGLVAFFAPVVAAIAVVGAAIAILYDDIQAFQRGSDSVIGEAVKRWPILSDVFRGLGQIAQLAFSLIGAGIQLAVTLVKKFFSSIGDIHDAFIELGSSVKGIWDGIVQVITSAIETIMAAVGKVVATYEKTKDFLGFGDAKAVEVIKTAQQTVNFASTAPIGSASGASIANSSKALTRNTTVSVGDVTIQTQATSSDGIAAEFNKSLEAQIRQATNNFDDGVLA